MWKNAIINSSFRTAKFPLGQCSTKLLQIDSYMFTAHFPRQPQLQPIFINDIWESCFSANSPWIPSWKPVDGLWATYDPQKGFDLILTAECLAGCSPLDNWKAFWHLSVGLAANQSYSARVESKRSGLSHFWFIFVFLGLSWFFIAFHCMSKYFIVYPWYCMVHLANKLLDYLTNHLII